MAASPPSMNFRPLLCGEKGIRASLSAAGEGLGGRMNRRLDMVLAVAVAGSGGVVGASGACEAGGGTEEEETRRRLAGREESGPSRSESVEWAWSESYSRSGSSLTLSSDWAWST